MTPDANHFTLEAIRRYKHSLKCESIYDCKHRYENCSDANDTERYHDTELARADLLEQLTPAPVQMVWAEWFVHQMPEDLGEFYIQCGQENADTGQNDDFSSFDWDEEGGTFTVRYVTEDWHDADGTHKLSGYRVRLECPAEPLMSGIEEGFEYWLSPSYIDKQEGQEEQNPEADFGVSPAPTPDRADAAHTLTCEGCGEKVEQLVEFDLCDCPKCGRDCLSVRQRERELNKTEYTVRTRDTAHTVHASSVLDAVEQVQSIHGAPEEGAVYAVEKADLD